MSAINELIFCLLLISLSLIIYYNTIYSEFVWDDRAAIISNNDVIGSDGLIELFQNDFWGQSIRLIDSHKSYRPITVISFKLNYLLHGLNSAAFHITNVIIYSIVSILVYYLNKLWFSTPVSRLSSLLFVCHPIHVESVASVVGRADLLCSLFYIISIICYNKEVDSSNYFLSISAILAAWLSCFSKEIGITVFGMFIVIEITTAINNLKLSSYKVDSYSNMFKIIKSIIIELFQNESSRNRIVICLFQLILVTIIRLIINGKYILYTWTKLENHIHLLPSIKERSLSYAYTHFWYLFKLFHPVYLSFDYGFSCIDTIHTFVDIRNGLSLLAYSSYIGLILFGIIKLSSNILFTAAFMLIPLVPALNVFFPIGTVLADRLLFLPSIGACSLIAIVLDPQKIRWKIMRLAIIFSLLGLWIYISSTRVLDWKSEMTLYKSALAVCPDSVKALTNTAALSLKRDEDRIIGLRLIARSIELYPEHVAANLNAGLLLYHMERWKESINYFEKCIRLDVKEDRAFVFASAALSMLSERQSRNYSRELRYQALKYLRNPISRGYLSPLALHTLGTLAYAQNNLNAAARCYSDAVLFNKRSSGTETIDEASTLNQLGSVYYNANKPNEAIAAFKQALHKKPDMLAVHANLGSVYMALNRFQEAVEIMIEGVSIGETNVPAGLYNNLGLTLSHMQKYDEALRFYRIALSTAYKHNQEDIKVIIQNNINLLIHKIHYIQTN